jgi:hypothetical protein
MRNSNIKPDRTSRIIAFRIPSKAYADYKAKCKSEGRTLSQAAKQGVTDFMAIPQSKATKPKPPANPSDTFDTGGNFPDIEKWDFPDL